MANEYVNKVVLSNGETLIDLSTDTVTAADVASGAYVHLPNGQRVQGTSTKDSDTSDATATAAEILLPKIAYVNGVRLTGTMPNNGGVTGNISTKTGQYTVPQGYHDGSGKVGIASTEQAKIIAGNIKAGIEILGVTGTYSGESVDVRSATATPTFSQQVVLPGAGYDYLSQVTVEAIPVTRADNPQGGVTVTIG